jgi:hypothetical protein
MMEKVYSHAGKTSMHPLPGSAARAKTEESVMETEILNWDYALEETPVRPSGTVQAILTRTKEAPPVGDPD